MHKQTHNEGKGHKQMWSLISGEQNGQQAILYYVLKNSLAHHHTKQGSSFTFFLWCFHFVMHNGQATYDVLYFHHQISCSVISNLMLVP